MGRELRKVIPNWEHPKKENINWRTSKSEMIFQPMFDRSYIDAVNEWIEEHQLWEQGNHPDQDKQFKHYAEYSGNPPDIDEYRPDWKEEEMTWFQVYETVSEGTPVTPPFETKEELINYLVENGDYWDQKRRKKGGLYSMPCDPWTRKQAKSFVLGVGWTPSGVIKNGIYKTGIQALADLKS